MTKPALRRGLEAQLPSGTDLGAAAASPARARTRRPAAQAPLAVSPTTRRLRSPTRARSRRSGCVFDEAKDGDCRHRIELLARNGRARPSPPEMDIRTGCLLSPLAASIIAAEASMPVTDCAAFVSTMANSPPVAAAYVEDPAARTSPRSARINWPSSRSVIAPISEARHRCRLRGRLGWHSCSDCSSAIHLIKRAASKT